MLVLKRKNVFIYVLVLTITGAFLHFYNLNWGTPYYFHPDERNIASSVTQLNFPAQMNPRFFAYGSFPIYTIYFTGVIINFFLHTLLSKPYSLNPDFAEAILISRFYSAFFSTLLIPVLFFIGQKLQDKTTGFLAAILATFSTGFIQFAHFGTFEMWLTFFGVILFWLCLEYAKHVKLSTLIYMAITFGILVAVKVSSLVLLPLPLAVVFVKEFQGNRDESRSKRQETRTEQVGGYNFLVLIRALREILLFFLIGFFVYAITNPFVFLDTSSFLGSMQYESSVALGTEMVFYTGEFFGKLPVVFQFLHIYLFLINPVLTTIFIPAFFLMLFQAVKQKKSYFLLLASYFLLLFFSQAVLFVKWTRYMMPTLPFMYLIIVIAVTDFLKMSFCTIGLRIVSVALLITSIIFSFSYFITVFVEPDTRIQAKQFAVKTIPSDAPILSEAYDLGITPFNDFFHTITLFNFYDLDNNSPTANTQTLHTALEQSDYIVLPSQRILKIRLLNKQKFPNGYQFYSNLLNGSLGFKKIYETPCDLFCQITYMGSPVYSFEETANVFDRPEVYIFKKVQM